MPAKLCTALATRAPQCKTVPTQLQKVLHLLAAAAQRNCLEISTRVTAALADRECKASAPSEGEPRAATTSEATHCTSLAQSNTENGCEREGTKVIQSWNQQLDTSNKGIDNAVSKIRWGNKRPTPVLVGQGQKTTTKITMRRLNPRQAINEGIWTYHRRRQDCFCKSMQESRVF